MAVSDINVDKKKYNKMEQVLQSINKNFITVNDVDAKKANVVLKHVIEKIVGALKETSPLFKELFTDILYGGSVYDGLKVGKPEEFDIDLRFSLPRLLEVTLETGDQPGFVRLRLQGWSNFEKNKTELERFRGLEKFKDANNYLLVDEVLKWMESIVTLTLNNFPQSGKKYLIPYDAGNIEVTTKKSGPAVTLLITYGNLYMDVDLVAVFKMSQDKWPTKPFKKFPENNPKKDFMVVPKSPRSSINNKNRYWRLSFQEQEKVIISGLNTCKTSLRIIKKLRDTQNHKSISSYFIKTVFLHEIGKQKPEFWNTSLSCVLMHMLKTYKSYLDDYKIPYYWNTGNNLLQYVDRVTIDNFKNFLDRVIKSVDRSVEENPLIIAEFLSTAEELAELKKVPFSFYNKKPKENVSNVVSNNIAEAANLIDLLDLHDTSCNKPLNNSLNTNEIKTDETPNINDKIILLLQNLQSSMNILQSDLKFATTKIAQLEYSVQELKTDNVELKNIVRSSTFGDGSLNLTKQLNNHGGRIDELNDKFESLTETVESLQSNNDKLKSGLRAFVF